MFDNFAPTSAEYIRILPELILTLAGLAIMFFAALQPKEENRGFFFGLTGAALLAALAGAIFAGYDPGPAFNNMLLVDGFATFFRVIVITVGILTVLSSYRFLERQNAETGEYHALLLYSIVGQSLMAAANELITGKK